MWVVLNTQTPVAVSLVSRAAVHTHGWSHRVPSKGDLLVKVCYGAERSRLGPCMKLAGSQLENGPVCGSRDTHEIISKTCKLQLLPPNLLEHKLKVP